MYHPFFHQTDRLIENHGDDAQENDRQNHPVKFEDLAAVDNEKSQSLPGSDKFTDDRTPMQMRNAPEFKQYFQQIWKELNHDT